MKKPVKKIRSLDLFPLLEGLKEQASTNACLDLSFEERLSMLIDFLYVAKMNAKTQP